MTWSTSQLADLAGTTVKAIRHYHQIGLLDIPERSHNGYKQYQTAHLVRLIRIIRLKELGVPLATIASMDDGGEDVHTAIAVLDEELAQTITKLQRIRAELAVLLQHQAPLVTPAPFEAVARTLSERDQALITVYAQAFDGEDLDDLRQLITERGDEEDEFETLPDDADDDTIEAIAHDLAVVIREHHQRFPWLSDPAQASKIGQQKAQELLAPAIAELYNTAQVKALARATAIINEQAGGS